MSKYNFDEMIDRRGTYCTQWDYIADRFGRGDLLPFTISDMDFAAPPQIIAELEKRMKHPVFGYSRWNHAEFRDTITNWYQRRYQCAVGSETVIYSPAVLFSITLLLELLTQPGDGVIIQNPAYDAFFRLIPASGCRVVVNNLLENHGEYRLDYADLERCAKNARVLIWCNPHNPTGRVWTAEETQAVVDICRRNNVKIISDEIHSDIVYAPNKFISLAEYPGEDLFVVTSASKTFNIPGLQGSYGFIRDEKIRNGFLDLLKNKYALSCPSIFGMYGIIAAYRDCDDWLDELVSYLSGNMECIEQFVLENKLGIDFHKPQGTYLAWLDCSRLGMTDARLQEQLINNGKVAIMSGANYGKSGFLRLNAGCSRAKLVDGLQRLKKSI
ncbi:MAG: MalY/PatB family protein [Negativicutes bacterium]|jgi:cystathionine beta-lyase